MKIGIFYGSDTGNTEDAANKIAAAFGEDNVELHDMSDVSASDFEQYDFMIIGTSTWYDGELQGDWEDFFDELDDIDFSGKTVALFGLGDQETYGDYFCDGVGIIYEKVVERGAKVVGEWSTDGYEFDESKAEKDGKFVGLTLDEDNQSDESDDRIEKWVEQIKGDFVA